MTIERLDDFGPVLHASTEVVPEVILSDSLRYTVEVLPIGDLPPYTDHALAIAENLKATTYYPKLEMYAAEKQLLERAVQGGTAGSDTRTDLEAINSHIAEVERQISDVDFLLCHAFIQADVPEMVRELLPNMTNIEQKAALFEAAVIHRNMASAEVMAAYDMGGVLEREMLEHPDHRHGSTLMTQVLVHEIRNRVNVYTTADKLTQLMGAGVRFDDLSSVFHTFTALIKAGDEEAAFVFAGALDEGMCTGGSYRRNLAMMLYHLNTQRGTPVSDQSKKVFDEFAAEATDKKVVDRTLLLRQKDLENYAARGVKIEEAGDFYTVEQSVRPDPRLENKYYSYLSTMLKAPSDGKGVYRSYYYQAIVEPSMHQLRGYYNADGSRFGDGVASRFEERLGLYASGAPAGRVAPSSPTDTEVQKMLLFTATSLVGSRQTFPGKSTKIHADIAGKLGALRAEWPENPAHYKLRDSFWRINDTSRVGREVFGLLNAASGIDDPLQLHQVVRLFEAFCAGAPQELGDDHGFLLRELKDRVASALAHPLMKAIVGVKDTEQ